jgi:hypothetical protein
MAASKHPRAPTAVRAYLSLRVNEHRVARGARHQQAILDAQVVSRQALGRPARHLGLGGQEGRDLQTANGVHQGLRSNLKFAAPSPPLPMGMQPDGPEPE